MKYDAQKSVDKINEYLNSDLESLFKKMATANQELINALDNVSKLSENIELQEKLEKKILYYCEKYKLDKDVVFGFFRVSVAISVFD